MDLLQQIAVTHEEATASGSGKLTGKELAFIRSLYKQSQSLEFTGLSTKQEAWFNAIATRLEATKGIPAFVLIGEKHRRRFERYRNAYDAACFGY